MTTVQRRAQVHAALGDPARLAIVDRLVLEDVSPGVLAEAMGLPTNLLAHHLKVLEESGVVRRVRSEGDRRRSYVQLVLDDPLVAALTQAASAGAPAAERVVFVCTRNSARSQLAAAAWRRASRIPVASAGTRPAERVHPGAVAAGRRHGLRMGNARTAQVEDVVGPGDLLVAVCDNAFEELPPGFGGGAGARLHWAVPDPVPAGTGPAFDAAYDEITARVGRLAAALTDERTGHR